MVKTGLFFVVVVVVVVFFFGNYENCEFKRDMIS